MPVLSSSTHLVASTRAAWQSQVAAAKRTPGLLPLLVRQRQDLLPRFASVYHSLRTLPRRLRRLLQRRWGQSLAGVALLLTVQPAASWAANFTAGTAAQLITAINTANGNGQADTITLTADITLTAVDNTTFGPTGLPVVNTEITIQGNNNTILRPDGAPAFRLLAVHAPSELTIQNTTFSGGKLPPSQILRNGGAIANYLGQLRLEGCTISGNSAAGEGGGVYSSTDATISNALEILDSTISGNSAVLGGGVWILASNNATLTLANSTFSDNSVSNYGGGVFIHVANFSTVTLTNSTVSGNSADEGGGGMFVATYGDSTLTLSRTLITGNTATRKGNEIFGFIISGTVAANNANLFGHDGLTNAQAFSGFTPGAADVTATSNGTTPTALVDILDTTLAPNGGPTQTQNLVPGSPAIDASPDDADCEPTDQRGVSRPQGPACDIGAVEFVANPPAPTFAQACGTAPTFSCTVNGKKNQLCVGTAGNDIIIGTKGNDVILGLGGNDLIKGGEGDDCIDGGPGNDQIEGQDGKDVLFGGGGNDTVRGGRGDELIVTGSGNDTVQGDEGNDTLFDSGGTSSLKGGNGKDRIYAWGASGTIDGGPGVDLCIGGTVQVNCP